LDAGFFISICRLIQSLKPDIIHVHSRRGADIWGGLAGKMLGVRTVLTRRVDNPEPGWAMALKYRLYDRVIAISKGIFDILKTRLPIDKMACVPSAVDTDKFFPDGPNTWFVNEFGLSGADQTVGMIAQFIERKGHAFALQAIPQILANCPDAKFLFFGKGPVFNEIVQAAKQRGLAKACIFAGFRTDLEKVLPCLDVVMHPSLMEGLGVSLLQSAASGVPIVSTPVGGIPEIVDHGSNGFLVPPKDASALAAAVSTLLTDQRMASAFGRNGREKVRRYFSIEGMVQGNASIYRELMSS
jgi:glycosyltransferase involved in cell wall biosynthesis